MNGSMDFIEAYFNRELDEEQRLAFENRCATNNEFAQEVAFYLSARGALRDVLLQQKQAQWKATEENTTSQTQRGKPLLLRLMPYAAAACLLLAVAFYFLFRTETTTYLAKQYIEDNYSQLSHTMDASRDSIELGIAEYNNRNYKKALTFFETAAKNDPANSYAIKYAGLSYLQMNDFPKALDRFQQLSDLKGLFSNGGDFLQAITLLKRDAKDDKAAAKKLLQKVVTNHEEGEQEARILLQKL